MSPMSKRSLLATGIAVGCAVVFLSCGAGVEPTRGTKATDVPSTDKQSASTWVAVEDTPAEITVEANAATTASSASSSSSTSGTAGSSPEVVPLRFESKIEDVPVSELQQTALAVLNDKRGWVNAGFQFVADPDSAYRVVLAEGDEVDRLCLPLKTGGTVSCQNGPVVALNADRWRLAVPHWDAEVEDYRGYLINHEVGHLIGQRHPEPRCPAVGRPAGVMEQQTGGLKGCTGNAWPRGWEIEIAQRRPVVYAPFPDWAPDPVPTNSEGSY